MDRRLFSKTAAGLGLSVGGWGMTASAQAQQPAFVEGKDYTRVGQKAPTTAPQGKVEVVEFFWYGCPHCFAFEPALEAWAKKVPPYLVFKRNPVAFRKVPFEAHQKIFYALEALGQVGAMHSKVFAGLHKDHLKLDNEQEIADYLAKQGLDKAKFLGAYNSFGVATKCRQAQQLSEAYNIDGVPTVGIDGRFLTSASMTGSEEKALQVVNFLAEQIHQGKI